ncbi:hypothetical protein GGQ99_001347 [Aminobacter niigataensis]|uniref:Uncharacterized protein n=1 Tax=Aminobacter niigataensis TaxID=83265 RepID=A0ABR6KYL0_9HYPH|nr:hypothetical protein [Aminobacter niigataensis]MBB4649625.1 hypothetical protein [Aminobacter niigataensis]
MTDNLRAPVQGYSAGIPWSLHLRAWDVYAKKYGRSQTAERLAERGGFGTQELDIFVPGWRDEVSEITRLQEALAAAEAEVERLLPIEAEAAEGREINGELRTKLVEAEARLTALRWAGAGLANIAHNIHQLGAADPSALQSLKSSQIEWDAAIRSLSNDEAPK